jgi:hypothetical protein
MLCETNGNESGSENENEKGNEKGKQYEMNGNGSGKQI